MTLANTGKSWRITGGMDTCSRSLELNGLRPADQAVAWQVAVIEKRNPPAREIHETLVRNFTGIEPHFKPRLELQNTHQQEEVVEAKAFGNLVGQSAAVKHIVSQIDMVAPTEASVLILGEAGKE
jgi:transcriptional regulator with AAA-type ATPase domain